MIYSLIKEIGRILLFDLIPDKYYIKWRFKKRMGYKLDLKKPVTLNEKIQWLKLYDRTPLLTKCADKIGVREYVENHIGSDYLIPLVFHSADISDLTLDIFPDYPVILKANHDSGTYFIISEKNNINLDKIRKELSNKLNKNYYRSSKEWQYKNIKPRFLLEKLLVNGQGDIPFDYKVHCFNGEPKMIQVDLGRGTSDHRRNWYNTAWEREPYYWASIKNGRETLPADYEVEKPKNLDLMLDLSRKLSDEFSYVRVDWYVFEGKLYFGELTFHHDSGYRPIVPRIWDIEFGKLVALKNGL